MLQSGIILDCAVGMLVGSSVDVELWLAPGNRNRQTAPASYDSNAALATRSILPPMIFRTSSSEYPR